MFLLATPLSIDSTVQSSPVSIPTGLAGFSRCVCVQLNFSFVCSETFYGADEKEPELEDFFPLLRRPLSSPLAFPSVNSVTCIR